MSERMSSVTVIDWFKRKAKKERLLSPREIAATGIECGLEPSSWTPPPGEFAPITYQKTKDGRIVYLPPGTRITTRYSQ